MKQRINPEMLILARESRGLTQAELAETLSVTQASVSRYESGYGEVPDEFVLALSTLTRKPVSFFYWQEKLYSASCMYHRKCKITMREMKMIHAQVNFLRVQATRLLRSTKIESSYQFHRLDMQRYGGPEGCARKLRRLWQLPSGPIRNVVRCIESAGGIVFRCPFGGVKVDGISQWPLDEPSLPPVFFVSADAPGDRERWTLCHEIGHVVMHHLPTDDPEKEANRFASEFLMPADEIAPELSDMSLQKAAALKSAWKVAMQAIIFRAHDLKKITDATYSYLFRELSARGYRKCEPLPIPPEEPEILREVLRVHRTALKRPLDELSDLVGMLEEDFLDTYWQSLSGLRLAV